MSSPGSSTTGAVLRLMSDLRAIRVDPPQGCSASPHSEENLFVWTATIFVRPGAPRASCKHYPSNSPCRPQGPDETPWEVRASQPFAHAACSRLG